MREAIVLPERRVALDDRGVPLRERRSQPRLKRVDVGRGLIAAALTPARESNLQENQICSGLWREISRFAQASRRRLRRCNVARVKTRPVQTVHERGQLRGRQTHHAVADRRPAKRPLLESFPVQNQAGAVPGQNLQPVRPFSNGRRGSSRKTDRVEARPSPAPPGCQRHAGSRQASSPPEPERPPEPKSRRRLHRPQHLRQRRQIGSRSNAHHGRAERDLDRPGRRWAGRRHGRPRLRPSCLHKNRREAHLGRVVALTPGRAPAHVTTPAEQRLRRQPMPPRDSRHFVPALVTLGENPRFLFGRPRPPSARSGEDLKPTKRLPLRFVQKLSVRHVSNSLSTQRRQTIEPAPHRGRCGLTTAYGAALVWGERCRAAVPHGHWKPPPARSWGCPSRPYY